MLLTVWTLHYIDYIGLDSIWYELNGLLKCILVIQYVTYPAKSQLARILIENINCILSVLMYVTYSMYFCTIRYTG